MEIQGFSTPDELMAYLKKEFNGGQLAKSDQVISPINSPNPANPLFGQASAVSLLDHLCCGQYRVDCLMKEILPVLPGAERRRVWRNLAAGAMVTTKFHATCIKSADEKYAVLINQGLLMFLNKMLKIDLVKNRPELIGYFSGKENSNLDSQDLKIWQDRMIENYRQLGTPQGPLIGLDESLQHLYYRVLFLWHGFILCHEIAHFLNGDLKDRLIDSRKLSWLLAGERNYAREYRADETAYRLLKKAVKRRDGYNLDERFILVSLIRLFHHIGLISNDPGSTIHPPSQGRVLFLGKRFFGIGSMVSLADAAEEDFLNCLEKY